MTANDSADEITCDLTETQLRAVASWSLKIARHEMEKRGGGAITAINFIDLSSIIMAAYISGTLGEVR